MKVVNLKNVSTEDIEKQFEEFYNTSIFTWEGMSDDEDNLEAIIKELKLNDDNTIYIYSGKQMNSVYHLNGKSEYPEDLTFVSIKYYYNPMVKLQVGARWFDDIVDNNRWRNNNEF